MRKGAASSCSVAREGVAERRGRKRGEGGKKEKRKGKRKKIKRERERERKEIAPAEFAAATAAGCARALVGNVQRVARNEGKKGMG